VACSHIATKKKMVLAQMMTMAFRLSVTREDMSISMMKWQGAGALALQGREAIEGTYWLWLCEPT